MKRSTERILTTHIGSLPRPKELWALGWEPRVHPEIMWAKFRAMVEGARIATEQLWGKASTA